MKLRLIHSFLMALVLSLLMTCWVTFINLGYSETFFTSWFKAFYSAFPVALTVAFFAGPNVLKLAQKLAGVKPK